MAIVRPEDLIRANQFLGGVNTDPFAATVGGSVGSVAGSGALVGPGTMPAPTTVSGPPSMPAPTAPPATAPSPPPLPTPTGAPPAPPPVPLPPVERAPSTLPVYVFPPNLVSPIQKVLWLQQNFGPEAARLWAAVNGAEMTPAPTEPTPVPPPPEHGPGSVEFKNAAVIPPPPPPPPPPPVFERGKLYPGQNGGTDPPGPAPAGLFWRQNPVNDMWLLARTPGELGVTTKGTFKPPAALPMPKSGATKPTPPDPRFPYQWPDGSWHRIPQSRHDGNPIPKRSEKPSSKGAKGEFQWPDGSWHITPYVPFASQGAKVYPGDVAFTGEGESGQGFVHNTVEAVVNTGDYTEIVPLKGIRLDNMDAFSRTPAGRILINRIRESVRG